LAFAHPMTEPAVNAAIAAMALPLQALVLDTGCGSGEILLRTLRLHASARGLGIDLDADAIAEARLRASGLQARFEVRDARYEETLAANAERHDAPDTRAYARQIRRRRALPGGTDTLGFALLVLRA
jgi:SAM-dependent methyltransferase